MGTPAKQVLISDPDPEEEPGWGEEFRLSLDGVPLEEAPPVPGLSNPALGLAVPGPPPPSATINEQQPIRGRESQEWDDWGEGGSDFNEDAEDGGLVDDDEEPPGGEKWTPFFWGLSLIGSLGGLLFGIDTGVISSALVLLRSPNSLHPSSPPLTSGQQEFIVSATTLGALAGSLVAGPGRMADGRWAGRRGVIIISSVLFTLGALLMTFTQSLFVLILGRFVVGTGVGLASMTIPVYFAELAPKKMRGRLVTMQVVAITFGQVLSYLIGALFYDIENGWRLMFLSSVIPSILQLILSVTILHESPRYLVIQGRIEEARKVLEKVYSDAPNLAERDKGVERVLRRIQLDTAVTANPSSVRRRTSLDVERGPLNESDGLQPRWQKGTREDEGIMDKLRQLAHDPPSLRALYLACGLQFFQQATGFNTLMYFSPSLLFSAGFEHPARAALVVAVTNWLCTLVSLRLIDRDGVGRRKLLLWTLGGMAIGMGIMGTVWAWLPNLDTADPKDPGAGDDLLKVSGWAAWIALAAMMWFSGCFALGLGNVPWVVQSEIFSNEFRSICGGIATGTNWLANFVVSCTFLDLMRVISARGTFWLYGVLCVIGWLFTHRKLPETKNLSIEETRRLFEDPAGGKPSNERTGYSVLANGPE